MMRQTDKDVAGITKELAKELGHGYEAQPNAGEVRHVIDGEYDMFAVVHRLLGNEDTLMVRVDLWHKRKKLIGTVHDVPADADAVRAVCYDLASRRCELAGRRLVHEHYGAVGRR